MSPPLRRPTCNNLCLRVGEGGLHQEHLRGHDWTYPNGKQAPRPEEKPLHVGLPVERDRVR